MESFDVLVVGGGAAGAAAAIAAAEHGRRTGLVRAGPGATALAGGGWRGPMPGRLGSALADAGLAYTSEAVRLPHVSGTLRRCDAAPAEHAAATLEDGALVCGIAGLPAVRARALARLWGDEAGVILQACALDLEDETPTAGWSPASLAAALDRQPDLLAEPLARAVHERDAPRAVLPPMLGLERAGDVRSAMEAAAGVPVGEMLAAPPVSVPGWRLDRALLRAVSAAGATVVRGRVAGRQRDGRRLVAVTAEQGDEELMLEAEEFVLATGKFAARGLTAADGLREDALDCPVRVENGDGSLEDLEPLSLTRAARGLPQPLLRAGVPTDDAARPIDRWNAVVYENVRVAGSIREGARTAALGLGAAARDGWNAGECAAREGRS